MLGSVCVIYYRCHIVKVFMSLNNLTDVNRIQSGAAVIILITFTLRLHISLPAMLYCIFVTAKTKLMITF